MPLYGPAILVCDERSSRRKKRKKRTGLECTTHTHTYVDVCFLRFVSMVVLEFVWSQEEPRNMGAWWFVKPRFENMCGRRIGYSGRSAGATVATGIAVNHKNEIERILSEPFTGSSSN